MATSDSPLSVPDVTLAVARGAGNFEGSGYIAFDVPVIRHATTGDSMAVRLVRREGITGSLTVTLSASDLFRPQGIQSYPSTSVTFSHGEMTKVIQVPINAVTLDGEAHFRMAITGNPITYNDIRWGETNLTAVIDDGSIASDGVVLSDPSTQIVQDNIADDTIVYLRDINGPWDDASVSGYTSGDPYTYAEATVINDKNNVVLRNYPGESPVFSTNGMAMYVLDSGYLNIYGIEAGDEITKTTTLGIRFETGVGYNGDITDNGPYIVDSCHFHHIYGMDNIGGIRLDRSKRAVVFNCKIHDTYDIRDETGNPITSEIYGLHSGIHGYEPHGCLIAQNTFYNVKRAVYQKTPDREGGLSHLLMRNLAYDISGPLAAFEHQGAAFPGNIPANSPAVIENIVIGASAASLSLHTGTGFSDGAKIYGNTCVDSDIGETDYTTDVRVWNNLATGTVPDNRVLTTRNNNDVAGGSIIYCDYNGYEAANFDYQMDRYATDQRTYSGLAAWQASSQETGFQTSVVNSPDGNAVTGAPLFTDAANGDYSLGVGSPYLNSGRHGDNIGAYRLGHEQIGATI